MIGNYKSRDITYFMDKFPEVKNLILSSEYISSCNFSMNFFPVALNADNEIGMSMRVPISAYLCIRSKAEGGVSFDKSIFYDAYHDSISTMGRNKYGDKLEGLEKYVTDYLEKHTANANVSINIIMPKDKNVGFGYKSFWSVMLAYRLLLETGQITDYAKRNSQHKDKIMEIVKDIYAVVGNDTFKRGTFLGPLRYSHTHPVYFTNKEVVNLYEHTTDELPVDIIVLNFGSGYERNITVKSINDFHTTMKEYTSKLHGNYKEDYLNNFAYCLKAEFINNYEKLISNSASDAYMQKLMTTIDHINDFARIIEGPNEMIDKINTIIKESKQFDNEYIGVLPLTSNQHSDNIVILANKNKSRKTLATILEKINQTNTCTIEYLSRIDNDYKNGIQIDHRQKKNIHFSKHDMYDCVVRSLDGTHIFGKYSEVASTYKDYLIVDSIANKIHMGEKSIGSAELPSQTYTISLIRKLMDNINTRVKNTELEPSAYSKSMNQITGKILSPLKKLTTELLGSPIDIQVTGSLYTYDIKLQSMPDKIIYVGKKE